MKLFLIEKILNNVNLKPNINFKRSFMEFIKSEAGSLESSDCLVSVEPSENFILEIVSTVDKQFHELIINDIKSTIEKFKNQHGISELPLKVKIEDRGALSFALKARVMTALSRSIKR